MSLAPGSPLLTQLFPVPSFKTAFESTSAIPLRSSPAPCQRWPRSFCLSTCCHTHRSRCLVLYRASDTSSRRRGQRAKRSEATQPREGLILQYISSSVSAERPPSLLHSETDPFSTADATTASRRRLALAPCPPSSSCLTSRRMSDDGALATAVQQPIDPRLDFFAGTVAGQSGQQRAFVVSSPCCLLTIPHGRAGVASLLTGQPFDTIKVRSASLLVRKQRWQAHVPSPSAQVRLQSPPTDGRRRYGNAVDALRCILKEEKVRPESLGVEESELTSPAFLESRLQGCTKVLYVQLRPHLSVRWTR